MTTSWWTPIALLIGSNVFMTTAWYGHLKFRESPIMLAILASWGIASIEYCMAVPANRIGRAVYSTAELKTMQEVITLVVFVFFSVFVLKEPITTKHGLGFALNDHKQGTGWACWTTTALFPVLHCAFTDAKMPGKFFLGHANFTSDGFHVEFLGDMHKVCTWLRSPFRIG